MDFSITGTKDSKVRFDYTLKIIILGDQNVGKSSFLANLAEQNDFAATGARCLDYRPNGHAEMDIYRNGKRILAKISDTGGQERFRSLTASFYRGAQGCLLMFDAENEASFFNIQKWHSDLEYYTAKQPMSTFIVGVNMQSPNRRVKPDQIDRLSNELCLPVHELILGGYRQSQNAVELVCCLLDRIVVHASRLPSVTIDLMSIHVRKHLQDLQKREQEAAPHKFQCSC